MITCDRGQTLCTVLTQPCGHIFSTRQALTGGCKSPHIISPALQWARALMLQARFTRQPAECGRWKAGAHLPSHMYMANKLWCCHCQQVQFIIVDKAPRKVPFAFFGNYVLHCSAVIVPDTLFFSDWLPLDVFWHFFFCPKVYASQVKQWSVSVGATWSCNGSPGWWSHSLWSTLTRQRGGGWWQLLCMNWYNLGLSLEEEG